MDFNDFLSAIKSILVITKLKQRIFFNSLLKRDTVFKVLTAIFLIYLIINSVGITIFFKSVVPRHAVYNYIEDQYVVALFIVFICNIFTSLIFGSYSLNKPLWYYPISKGILTLSEIFSIIIEPINIIFIPIYTSFYFVAVGTITFSSLLFFICVLLMFMFLIGNLLLIIRNTILISTHFINYKRILFLIAILSVVLLHFLLTGLTSVISSKENIVYFSRFLFLTPIGMFINLMIGKQLYVSLLVVGYFFALDFIFYSVNYAVIKKTGLGFTLRTGKTKINIGKYSVLNILKKISLPPIARGDIFFAIRSPRILIFLFLYALMAVYSFFSFLDTNFSKSDLHLYAVYTEYFIVLLQGGFFLNLYGNMFGSDINNLFVLSNVPVTPKMLFKQKFYLVKILSIINCVVGSLFLLYFKLPLLDYIFLLNILLLSYLTGEIFSFIMSTYFPKKTNYYNIWKTSAHFITILSNLVNMFFYVILVSVMDDSTYFYGIIFTLALIAVNFFMIFYRDRFFSKLYLLFINRTEHIFLSAK